MKASKAFSADMGDRGHAGRSGLAAFGSRTAYMASLVAMAWMAVGGIVGDPFGDVLDSERDMSDMEGLSCCEGGVELLHTMGMTAVAGSHR